MNDKTCAVCGRAIEGEPHTFHAEGCPLRDQEPHTYPSPDDCQGVDGCGEDVHESCCPTCTGQAFEWRAGDPTWGSYRTWGRT